MMQGYIASLFGPCCTVTAENIEETFKLARSELARLPDDEDGSLSEEEALEKGRLFLRHER